MNIHHLEMFGKFAGSMASGTPIAPYTMPAWLHSTMSIFGTRPKLSTTKTISVKVLVMSLVTP